MESKSAQELEAMIMAQLKELGIVDVTSVNIGPADDDGNWRVYSTVRMETPRPSASYQDVIDDLRSRFSLRRQTGQSVSEEDGWTMFIAVAPNHLGGFKASYRLQEHPDWPGNNDRTDMQDFETRGRGRGLASLRRGAPWAYESSARVLAPP